MSYIKNLALRLKTASREIASASTLKKNELLQAIAAAIIEQKSDILRANEQDMAVAAQNGISPIMLDRLMLNEERLRGIANGVKNVAMLTDPIGQIIMGNVLPNGLQLRQIRVALGCIGVIYESRPNVTIDAAVLCLKAGNAVMLRGGKEAIHSNLALAKAMQSAIVECGLSPDIVLPVEETSRETATEMMKLNGYLDVLIPRGGAGLIQSVVENSTIPVIQTGVGNCHIYVDQTADIPMAVEILNNAKTSRPSVCNACESLLVHRSTAEIFLPAMKERLSSKNVILLGCPRTKAILGDCVTLATDDDYAAEFLDYVLSVKVVDDLDEAIAHIAHFSSGHSESIITNDVNCARIFTEQVDSAAVYVNASTRFTDGEEFGFGAEIGISTQKLHARGPLGLATLTSSKYIIYGSGQIR